MSCLFWLLVLCCAVRGQVFSGGIVGTIWNKTQDQRDTIQEIFDLMQHRKIQCTANTGEQGTCLSRKDCSNFSGSVSGYCARNWGICCVLRQTCNSSTRVNGTYFTNPDYPGTSKYRVPDCSITVSKTNPKICQLRLDFHDFNIVGTGETGCTQDVFTVIGGSDVPPLCGENSEQHGEWMWRHISAGSDRKNYFLPVFERLDSFPHFHLQTEWKQPQVLKCYVDYVYVDFQSDIIPIKLSFQFGSKEESRRWNIKITQIECNSLQRAPPHMLMYFTEVVGRVKSFNYGSAPPLIGEMATRQLVNLNYVVGVQLAPGYCRIEWKQDPDDKYSFTVSGNTDAVYGLLGDPTVAEQGDVCTSNFVIIPNADVNTDRFCGNAFVEKRTSTKPFTLTVVTNNQQLPDNMGNRGFSLVYHQLLCP